MWGAGLEPIGLSVVLMLTALPLYWLRPREAGIPLETAAPGG